MADENSGNEVPTYPNAHPLHLHMTICETCFIFQVIQGEFTSLQKWYEYEGDINITLSQLLE